MRHLLNLDLFGKVPEFYYKGKTKKNTIIGLVFTFIQISLFLAFLIYKLVRMIKRKDVKYYDTNAFNEEIPSITITNEQFYGAFTVGGSIDETLYYITAQYISGTKNRFGWNNTVVDLELETCKLEKFGEKYRDFFKDETLNESYCLKDINLKLEGFSYLKNFSYVNVKVFPCINQTKDGRPCKDFNTLLNFFKMNYVEFKVQDNLLTPERYKSPVKPFRKDIQCPIYLQVYQKMHSYIQIVRIETDEDIYGIGLKPKHKLDVFTKYSDSFVIAAPGTIETLKNGQPVCDITLQLAANVLTQRRNYTTLLEVMGDVGGFMEFLYGAFRILLSFVIDESYEKSLVNNLFSFNKSLKLTIFKNKDVKNNMRDLERKDDKTLNFLQKDTKIYPEMNKHESYQSMITPALNNINKDLTNKDMTTISDSAATERGKRKTEKYEIVKRISTIFLFIRSKKKNLEKILYEEGMKLIKDKLDISNLFICSCRVEENKKILLLDKYVPISEKNKKYITNLEEKNNLAKKKKG